MAAACTTGGADAILASLRAGPHRGRLTDGTRLSDCVAHAISDTDLQNVGAAFIAAGDHLARRASVADGAAFQLGYLAGAAERGASGNEGIASELVDRLDRYVGDAQIPAGRRAAFDRGRAAGRRAG